MPVVEFPYKTEPELLAFLERMNRYSKHWKFTVESTCLPNHFHVIEENGRKAIVLKKGESLY